MTHALGRGAGPPGKVVGGRAWGNKVALLQHGGACGVGHWTNRTNELMVGRLNA